MLIPPFLSQDDYLQNPIMRRFLKEHNLNLVDNRADYINAIQDYSERSDDTRKETIDWLLRVAKEGSKEICYRKIYGISEWHRNPALVEAKIRELYPDCPQKNIITYTNTGEQTMIEYHITTNDECEVTKLDFTFSQLFLCGEAGKLGGTTVLPVFVEVYLESGFVVSRAKAKSTLYKYSETNEFLINEDRVDTMDYAISIVDKVIALLGFETVTTKQIVKNEVCQTLYRIYEKYSFTPEDVAEKVQSQDALVVGFVNQVFNNLQLNPRNLEKAISDAQILVEKFISINGNNENIFKKDRPAYLIKVTTDDDIELTKIDTSTSNAVPLQCTEAFFESKNSVIKSKKCNRLWLIFKRTNGTYFSGNPLSVQLGTHKNHGFVKTIQYAEEADIQNVLQAIFENY